MSVIQFPVWLVRIFPSVLDCMDAGGRAPKRALGEAGAIGVRIGGDEI